MGEVAAISFGAVTSIDIEMFAQLSFVKSGEVLKLPLCVQCGSIGISSLWHPAIIGCERRRNPSKAKAANVCR